MVDTIAPILFIGLIILVIIGIALHYTFLKRLRYQFPDIWQELGSPTIFLNNSIQNSLKTQGFLWKKKYAELADSQFVRLCNTLRMVTLFYIIYLVVCVFFGLQFIKTI